MNRALVILLGGLAGMAAAMLLAPEPGRDLLRGLRGRAEDLGSAAQDQLSRGRLRMTELMESGQELARQMRERAGMLKEKAREPVERMAPTEATLDQLHDALDKAQKMLAAARQALK